jgi:chromosome segregation ATPase
LKFQNKAGVQVTVANEVAEAADSPSAAPTPAQLANAESDRLDALEEAETATEDRDGYRRELARVRADVRRLEAALRTERHEHAETRARLSRPDASLAVATAEARLRHQSADYERRIADLTRQAALSEQRAREAREQADRVLVGAMLGAHQAARVLAEHGVRGES